MEYTGIYLKYTHTISFISKSLMLYNSVIRFSCWLSFISSDRNSDFGIYRYGLFHCTSLCVYRPFTLLRHPIYSCNLLSSSELRVKTKLSIENDLS